MNKSKILYTAAIIAAITGYSLSIGSAPESFQLMTEEEAQALQQKLSTLEGEERENYRREAYEELAKRAEASGYAMPEIPPQPAPANDPAPQVAETASDSATTPPEELTAETDPKAEQAPAAVEPEQGQQAEQAPAAAAAAAAAEPEQEQKTPQVAEAPAPMEQVAEPVTAPESTLPQESTPQETVASEAASAPASLAAEPSAAPAAVAEPPAPPQPPEMPMTQSRDEIIEAMDAHRKAMREYMKQRRAQQKSLAAQRSNVPPNRALDQIERKRALQEQQREAYLEQMEARREAMQKQIDSAINSLERGAPPATIYRGHPGYRQPYPTYYPYRRY